MTKAGKVQLFAAPELIAWRYGAEVLTASASAVLAKVGWGPAAADRGPCRSG